MKINVSNTDKLAAAIAAAEGPRYSARTITPLQVQFEVDHITADLDRLLAKKDQVGARVIVDQNAQTFPNAYKGTPYSTQFTVERFASGWFVTDVSRHIVMNANARRTLRLSSEQKEAMADRIVRDF